MERKRQVAILAGGWGIGDRVKAVRRQAGFCLLHFFAVLTWPAVAQRLPLQVYTTADGLAHNHINCIRQDSRGFLWICTDEGLTRFDGYGLISYTTRDGLPHSWINDLIETHDGALWIASDGGVSRFNPNRSATAEPMFTTWLPDQPPDAHRVNSLAEDASGAIWCATYNGLYRLDRERDKVRFQWVDIGLPGEANEGRLINNVAVDGQGALWLTARSGLYRRLPDGRSERYTTRNGLPDNFTGALLQDRDGRWWVATRLGGFCLLAPPRDSGRDGAAPGRVVEHCYSITDGLPHNDVRAIFQSSDGRMWVGTILGLSEFDRQAKGAPIFRNYTTANGLSEDQIYKLAEDTYGNLWIGTQRAGVMKMPRTGFVSYGEAEGFRSGTKHHDIFETTAGDLCVLTGTGTGGIVQRLRNEKFSSIQINLPHISTGNYYLEHGVQDRTGGWWLATRHGLVRIPSAARPEDLERVRPEVYTTADGLPSHLIDHVYLDDHGAVWIASTASSGPGQLQLRVANPPAGAMRLYAADTAGIRPIKNGPVTAMAAGAAGDLWLGFRNCVVRCRGGRFERLFSAPVIRGVVGAIHLNRDGRLWIASEQGGLYRVDDPASAQPHIARYTTADGMSSDEVLCLTEDEWGRVYAGTNRGIDRLDPKSGLVRHYTSADGLSRGTVTLAYRDRRGVLWFVTDEGVSRLTPAPDRAALIPPTVLVTGLRTMGVPHPVSALGVRRVENLRLASNRNQLQIDFIGLDFRPGAALRYRYKLEDADREWSAPTPERSVNYASLAPGSYRFMVQTVSRDGTASPRLATVAFTVMAPIWERWWFLLLCAFAVSLAIYTAHRFRVRQLLALERIRMRIATDLHDDIGASLSHIAVLSEVASSELSRLGVAEDGVRLQEPLRRIGTVSRELIDSMSDIVWAISPRQDRLRSLTQRMREFAGDVLSPRGIEFQIDAESDDQERRLDPELRRQVFLIFKECVHNIVRHSGSTRVVCDLQVRQGDLVMQLGDNGCGFDARLCQDRSHRGHGLYSMRRRAEALGGALEIKAEDKKGVTVTLHAPIT